MLIHSECGGALEVDNGYLPQRHQNNSGGIEILRGIKCKQCGAKLGMLANVDSDVPMERRRLAAEDAHTKSKRNRID